jgi:hypothetical protein
MKIFTKKTHNIFICFIFSILFTSINWEEVQGLNFVDKSQSLNVLTERTFELNLNFSFENLLFNITNEQLWNQGIRFLYFDLNIPILTIFYFISFISSFIFSYFILKKTKPIFLLLLFNPIIIDLFFSQFRFSLSISIFLLGIINYDKQKHRWLTFSLWISIMFIHTSSVIFIIIAILDKTLFKNTTKKIIIPAVLFGLIISLMLGPFRTIILTLVDDRRINYEIGSNNLLFSLFWIFYTLILIINMYFFSMTKSRNFILLILLCVFTFNTFFNIYSLRFLAVAFPFFIVSLISLKKEIKRPIILLYLLYSLLQWYYWIK